MDKFCHTPPRDPQRSEVGRAGGEGQGRHPRDLPGDRQLRRDRGDEQAVHPARLRRQGGDRARDRPEPLAELPARRRALQEEAVHPGRRGVLPVLQDRAARPIRICRSRSTTPPSATSSAIARRPRSRCSRSSPRTPTRAFQESPYYLDAMRLTGGELAGRVRLRRRDQDLPRALRHDEEGEEARHQAARAAARREAA